MVPTVDLVKTGRNIHNLRKQKGLSVRELQRILGFSTPQAIYKWQNGSALPTVDNLVILSKALSVPIDEILVLKSNAK